MELEDALENIGDKDNFADFLAVLRKDLVSNRQDWENPTLERFLESMEAWVRTVESFSKNSDDLSLLKPEWKTFATILLASKYYE